MEIAAFTPAASREMMSIVRTASVPPVFLKPEFGVFSMIRPCGENDFEQIYAIINDGAQAYKGIIPADRWTEPYMSREKLRHEIDAGVLFWGFEDGPELTGVMGIQSVQDVMLIRHAYVRGGGQRKGVGGLLLHHLLALTSSPVLVGTWADASWAIRFYEKNGFCLVGVEEKDRLLSRYWTIPQRQIETSVVLADARWWQRNPAS